MASTTIAELARFQIPLKDIQEATNNFHDDNIIAEGVYKGKLLRSEKRVKIFACKHLASGEDIEFLKEVSLLSVLKHKNIVSLIGFCDEKDEKIIVIAHERKGSLNVSLNNPILTWTQRLRISLSVARALNYLHYELPYSVIHQNINSYTILLDENWEPKLSGFSIHIKQPVQQRHEVVHSKTIGPSGYIDPEIEKRGGVTLNSDIYSFGVVLFEILCGKSAYNNEAKWPLAQLAKHHYENRKLKDIINPQVWSQILSPKQLAIYSTIAYDCLKEPGYRPNLQYIIEQLTEALNLQHLREKLVRRLFYHHAAFID